MEVVYVVENFNRNWYQECRDFHLEIVHFWKASFEFREKDMKLSMKLSRSVSFLEGTQYVHTVPKSFRENFLQRGGDTEKKFSRKLCENFFRKLNLEGTHLWSS